MNANKRKFFQWLIIVFSLSFSAYAQQAQSKIALPPTVESYKLNSRLMVREMPYRIILPVNYQSEKAQRYPVVYLLHGLTGSFDNWTERSKVVEYAAKYNYILVTPEGANGWYADSATVPNDKYESYIVQELVPEIDKKFRTVADRNHRAVAGLSMGGYGAIKFGLKEPEMFVLVGSFSGALQAASLTEKMLGNGWKALTDSIMSVYGAEDSQTRKANDVFKIVREMPADKMKNLPFIYFACGTEDGLIGTNREFSALLLEKKIPHEFRESPGIHDWKFWDAQIQEFLKVSEKFIK
ncbi:MAG: alpha/beta hydrolase [Pyrinomonadaceae bacterium]